MGTWHLEVVKMALYISFPITAMFMFSRPELFKDKLIESRKKYHPPPNPERDELVKSMLERKRLREEEKVLEQMYAYQKKQQKTINE